MIVCHTCVIQIRDLRSHRSLHAINVTLLSSDIIRGPFAIKMPSYQYRDSHYKDKTVSQQSYLYDKHIHARKNLFLLKRDPVWLMILFLLCRMWIDCGLWCSEILQLGISRNSALMQGVMFKKTYDCCFLLLTCIHRFHSYDTRWQLLGIDIHAWGFSFIASGRKIPFFH